MTGHIWQRALAALQSQPMQFGAHQLSVELARRCQEHFYVGSAHRLLIFERIAETDDTAAGHCSGSPLNTGIASAKARSCRLRPGRSLHASVRTQHEVEPVSTD